MRASVLSYLGSALAVAIAGLAAAALSRMFVLPHVGVLMLAAVLFSALRFGIGPSVFAALSGVAVSSFFFMPPIYSFAVHEPQDIVDLCVFAAVAILTGHLAARVRQQAVEAKRREACMRELYSLSRTLVGLLDLEGMLLAMVGHFCATLQRPVMLLLPSGGGGLRMIPPDARPLDECARHGAEQYWADAVAGKLDTTMLSAAGWNLHLLSCPRGPLGLLAVAQATDYDDDPLEEPADFDAMLEHAATIIERATGSNRSAGTTVPMELGRLKSF